MKRLGRVLAYLLATALTATTLCAVAETQLGGRDFNHMTTGFPLSGGHATAACETCHIGGVFKGAPRNCDGCHALGKRIVATPKSNSHLVTDAPCESCHFNTATFLGARYSHGSARLGDCASCHNGRISTGKHRVHIITTFACDSCHRTSSWIPAKWNHSGQSYIGAACATCHNGSAATGKTSTHTGAKGTLACDDCHRQTSWLPAIYTHRGVLPGSCATCHNGSAATGKTSTHTGAKGTLACDDCHRQTTSWLPASYNHQGVVAGTCASCHNGSAATGKTATHTGLKGTLSCDACHRTISWLPASYNHQGAGTCETCHNGISAMGKGATHISTTAACSDCHSSTTTWLGALGGKPANHIPYASTASCASCHVGAAVVTGNTLHIQIGSGIACYSCHGSSASYLGTMQKARWPNFHESSNNPAATDCSASGCHRPIGSEGSLYIKWN